MGGERVTDAEVLQIFRDTHALLEGHFMLRSGLHSRQYFQCAMVLQHPRVAERLCGDLAGKLKNAGAQVVISPALGGLFAQVVAQIQKIVTPPEVKLKRVRVADFFTGSVETEDQVKQAVGRLQDHLLTLLSEGVKIVLE